MHTIYTVYILHSTVCILITTHFGKYKHISLCKLKNCILCTIYILFWNIHIVCYTSLISACMYISLCIQKTCLLCTVYTLYCSVHIVHCIFWQMLAQSTHTEKSHTVFFPSEKMKYRIRHCMPDSKGLNSQHCSDNDMMNIYFY